MTRSELIQYALEELGVDCARCVLQKNCSDCRVEIMRKILLAEQKRSEGCPVCRGIKILHGTFHGVIAIDKGTQMEVDSDGDVDFRFCPECGRDLTEGESV